VAAEPAARTEHEISAPPPAPAATELPPARPGRAWPVLIRIASAVVGAHRNRVPF
jgi:hypothetical protein